MLVKDLDRQKDSRYRDKQLNRQIDRIEGKTFIIYDRWIDINIVDI